MLATTGSAEISYWQSELNLRAREEREAMDKAKTEAETRAKMPPQTMGPR